MAVDLHLHSTASDGSDGPGAVMALAARAGLTAAALTDHDTLAGIPEAAAAADRHGLHFIGGLELSVDWPTGTMHLLAYFVMPGPGPLQDRLAALRRGREIRNREMVAALVDLGIPITHEEVAAAAGGNVIGRPHMARVLVEKGIVSAIDEAFDRFLGNGRPAYRPRLRLGAAEAVRLTRESGGVPVIAHPHTIGAGAADYERAFRELAAEGLGGIEAHYAEYPPDLRAHLAGLADALGLVPTGGSDYHGTFKPGVAVGAGHGDLEVPDDTVARLIEWRSAQGVSDAGR